MVTKRRFVLVGLALATLISACSGGSASRTPSAAAPSGPTTVAAGAQVNDTSRPAGIPAAAALVRGDRTFGPGPGTPAALPQLFILGCKDGVLSVITSQIVELYAELPCDRAVPQGVVDRFTGKPVRVRIVFGSQVKLYLDSPAAGTLEFTVSRAWVKE